MFKVWGSTLNSRDGWKGWAALAAFVLVYDLRQVATGHQTLSDAYTDALAARPGVVLPATAYLVAHLLSRPRALIPVDPLRLAARHITNRRSCL